MSKTNQEISKTILTQFDELRTIIETSRNQTCRFVNEQLLNSYWAVGSYISQKLKTSEWGNKVVDSFSEYLQAQCPDIRGYGRSSLYNMVKFYNTYSSDEFTGFLSSIPQVNQVVQNYFGQLEANNQSTNNKSDIIIQNRFGQLQSTLAPRILYLINWSSHLYLLSYCRTPQESAFYMLYAHKENLNYEQLKRQIQTGAMSALLSDRSFLSRGFHDEYPQKMYDFKDRVFLEYLGLPDNHAEKHLQQGIDENIKQFILNLGADFLYMGSQYELQVGTKKLYVDLLFFHRGIQALCAIEIKNREFTAADLGQLEVYLEALDRTVRRSNENPSIGIILCPKSDRIMIEYAMNRTMSPAMVTEYESKLIPLEKLQTSLDAFCNFLESGLENNT
jgi:predicted nuclease of restriction endonuclease-like (RecB) superfamily